MAAPGTAPVREAHRFSTELLIPFLEANVSGYPLGVELKVSQFAHGQSNPTFHLAAGNNQYVLRKKPPGKLLPSAHAVDREYRVMTALRSTRVPVPRTYVLCEDPAIIGTAFYVMEYVQGRIFKDITLPGMDRTERQAIYGAMVTVLAELHKLDFDRLGLGNFGRRSDYAQRLVSRWTKQYNAAKTEEVPEMDGLIQFLNDRMPTDTKERNRVCIVHGDFRLDNMIFHPTQNRVIAVLDWELATLGHPMSDLAYNCIPYYIPPSQANISGGSGLKGIDFRKTGIPSHRELINAYHHQVGWSGPLQHYFFFVALSYFRMASISQGVYKRYLQGNASQKSAAMFGQVAKTMAGMGLAIARSHGQDVNALPPHEEDADSERLDRLQLLPFGFSTKFFALRKKLLNFMEDYIYPNESLLHEQHKQLTKQHDSVWVVPPVLEQLKQTAKAAGLWNLFMTKSKHHNLGPGLTNLEYAPLCEIMGRSLFLAPEVFNCSAPDTGNMEVLAMYGTPAQQERWLTPLMNGEIRSAYGMTEPMVASSDATNIETRIERDGNEYVINGRKWWTSGALDPRCKLCIVMGKTPNPTKSRHEQQSMILVPMDARGVRIVRHLTVFGYDDSPHGHAEVEFVDVRVPASNILLGEGRGFEIGQGRLGPGRIHHCMRTIGVAERAVELMLRRVQSRDAFGGPVSTQGTIMKDIADSRVEIQQARLLTLQAASMMDAVGNKYARQQIAMIKVVAPNMGLHVVDRALQAHGGMGVCQDTLLPWMYAQLRTLRLADGPDEVHRRTIAKLELRTSKL